MNKRLRWILPLIMLVALAPATPASARHRPPPTTITTVPATPNVRIVYRGAVYRTDRRGILLLPPGLTVRPRVLPTAIGPDKRAVFARWYGNSSRLRLALDIYYRVRLHYEDLQGRLVSRHVVRSMQIRSSIGLRFHPKQSSMWLHGTRVVPLNGSLEPKPIYYTIERVEVDGANVVNESQQKFFPSRDSDTTVQLLFYQARFRSRDAFFGFPVGHTVRLTFPQGTVKRYKLGSDGTLTLPSLPRGTYKVEIEGGGISLGGPVALSKDQDVKVAVFSYLDVTVALLVLLVFAVGLPLAKRPDRLRQLQQKLSALGRFRSRSLRTDE